MVHLISYELKGYRPRYQYEQLAEAIKSISGVWCHIPESKWLVETEFSTKAVAERLAPLTQIGDPLFVTRIYGDWSSYSLTQEQTTWLNGRNFGSFTELLSSLLPLPVQPPIGSLLPKPSPPVSGALVNALLGKLRP